MAIMYGQSALSAEYGQSALSAEYRLCMVITYSRVDQPGMVTNHARVQLERIYFFLSAFAPENLVSRDG